MDTINYFISENELQEQSNNNSYGVISPLQYRVTSLFIGGDNPMAYAVTEGLVFIVDQHDNPNRINLFLKPNNLVFGVPVKYFVYRGLLKSDFLDQNNSYNGIKPVSPNDSDFIKNIRKGKNGEVALNLFNDLSGAYFIDYLFAGKYQFALAQQGESIGRFDSLLNYGFEIMLDEPFFCPTLTVARKDINIIEISANVAEGNVSRLDILNYIDPAAYYGLFSHSSFTVGTNNNLAPKSRTKEGVYEFIKRFSTKNVVYIDIRDKYGHPIDWFEDDPPNIKVTLDGSSAQGSSEIPYRDINHFPIKILSGGWANLQLNDNNQKYFVLKLSLPILNNPTPLLSLHAGYWLKFVDEIGNDMIFSACTSNSGWSDDKEFCIFGIDDSGVDVSIANYLHLQLDEYSTMNAIEDQIPDENVESEEILTSLTGLFIFNTEGIPGYEEEN